MDTLVATPVAQILLMRNWLRTLFHFPKKHQQPPVSMRILWSSNLHLGMGPQELTLPLWNLRSFKTAHSLEAGRKKKKAECSQHHVKAVNIAVGDHTGYMKQKSLLSTYVTVLQKKKKREGTSTPLNPILCYDQQPQYTIPFVLVYSLHLT